MIIYIYKENKKKVVDNIKKQSEEEKTEKVKEK